MGESVGNCHFYIVNLTIILGRAKGLGREQKDLEEKK